MAFTLNLKKPGLIPTSISLEDQTADTTINSKSVSRLAENSSTTLTYSWNTEDGSRGEHILKASHDFGDEKSNNNSRPATIAIAEPAEKDIAITDAKFPSSATSGDEVEIEISLENTSTQSIDEDINISLEDQTDEITIATKTISEFEAGSVANIKYTWNTGEASIGDHTLNVTHNFDDDNEENNFFSAEITISEQQKNDLAITVVSSPSSATRGDEVEIEVTLENAGNQSINENIDVTLEDQTDNTTISTQTISELEAGATTTLTYNWYTGEASTGDHELEASPALEDDDNSNNSQTTTVTISEQAIADTDIAITELNAPSSVTQGDTANIDATIENIGDNDFTDSITVTFMHHQETLGAETIEGGLNAGSSVTVTYGWDTTGEGTGSPPHPIDVSHNIEDEDNTNNEDTVEILVEEPEN